MLCSSSSDFEKDQFFIFWCKNLPVHLVFRYFLFLHSVFLFDDNNSTNKHNIFKRIYIIFEQKFSVLLPVSCIHFLSKSFRLKAPPLSLRNYSNKIKISQGKGK